MKFLYKKNVETRINYPIPLHLQKPYQYSLRSDLEGINDRFEFFEMFGYSPTAKSIKNLERGLTASGESPENIAARVGNFGGVKTPLASYGEESSNLFFGKFLLHLFLLQADYYTYL